MGRRARRSLARQAEGWPPNSPGAINAWLLLVTTKPPVWRDPLVRWVELPPTLGQPHEGFFYPDPLGFWAEVRKWAVELTALQQPEWGQPEALSVTSLLHVGEEPERLTWVRRLSRPRVVLFLDEPSWERSGIESRPVRHYIDDPHRPGQVYEGVWGTVDDGVVVGKAPQHPTTHSLYRSEDMAGYLRAAPVS